MSYAAFILVWGAVAALVALAVGPVLADIRDTTTHPAQGPAVTTTRYGATASGTRPRGHLLNLAPRRAGQLTTALCGEKRRTWQPVDQFADPTAFTDCAECTRLHTARTTLPTPVRIAPTTPPAGTNEGPPRSAVEHTTQAGRTHRRTSFAATFGGPQGYRPRTYTQHLVTDDE